MCCGIEPLCRASTAGQSLRASVHVEEGEASERFTDTLTSTPPRLGASSSRAGARGVGAPRSLGELVDPARSASIAAMKTPGLSAAPSARVPASCASASAALHDARPRICNLGLVERLRYWSVGAGSAAMSATEIFAWRAAAALSGAPSSPCRFDQRLKLARGWSGLCDRPEEVHAWVLARPHPPRSHGEDRLCPGRSPNDERRADQWFQLPPGGG